MGLLLGLAMLTGVAISEAKTTASRKEKGRIMSEESNPEVRHIISEIARKGEDDRGVRVDVVHRNYPKQVSRNEIIYQLAKNQCYRNGIRWGETEARIYCPCESTRQHAYNIGLYKDPY